MNNIEKLRKIAKLSPLGTKRAIQKRIANYKRDKYSRKLINTYLESQKIKKLHIGCGQNLLNDWLNTDLHYGKQIAYLDATKTFPFPDNTFQYSYSEHLIEHIEYPKQMKMLQEILRVTKKGGKIRIVTPNFDFLVRLYTEKTEIHQNYINWAFQNFLNQYIKQQGNYEADSIAVINNFVRDWGHKFIHNPKSLKLLLSDAGFTDIRQETVNDSSEPHFINIEQHQQWIPTVYNDLESMVFTAMKR